MRLRSGQLETSNPPSVAFSPRYGCLRVIGKKKRSITEGNRLPPQPAPVRYPIGVLMRMFLLGSVAIAAAGWAIWRHYNVPRAPMVVPTQPAPSASEIEIDMSR